MKNLIGLLVIILSLINQKIIAQDLGTGHDALSVLKGSIWTNPTCDVCWENSNANNATERGWVRAAIAKTWEKESAFKFTGWGACLKNSKGIRILISDTKPNERPHTSGLGKTLDGMVNGMVLILHL